MTIGMVSVAGGGLTLVGSTPQLIAQGILKEGGYGSIGFFEFAIVGGPILALMVVFVLTIGYRMMKRVFDFPEQADPVPDAGKAEAKKPEVEGAGPRKYSRLTVLRMCISVAVLVFCVVGFIAGLWTTGVVAMAGAVICIITGCISQENVFKKLNWTAVVVLGCSFGVAAGLEQSGAGRMIAHGMLGLLGDNLTPWLLCAVLAFVACILSNFMSSTATAALLVPIAALVAAELGYNVKAVAIAIAVAINIGYTTPISTPPMTMTLSAGYRFKDYVKVGGLMNLLAYLSAIALFPLIL
jgi:anion transporter